jgi:hypothetical protein
MNLHEGTRRLALLLGVVGALFGGFASYVELQSVIHQRALHERFDQLANSDVVRLERKTLQAWTPVPDKWAQYAVKRKNTRYLDPKSGEPILIDPQTGNGIETDTKTGKSFEIDPKTGERIKSAPRAWDANGNPIPSAAPTRAWDANGNPVHIASSPVQIDPKTGRGVLAQNQGGSANPGGSTADLDLFIPSPSDVNSGGVKTINWAKNYGVYSIETEDGQTLFPIQPPSLWLYLLAAIFPVAGFLVVWGTIRAIGWVVTGFARP